MIKVAAHAICFSSPLGLIDSILEPFSDRVDASCLGILGLGQVDAPHGIMDAIDGLRGCMVKMVLGVPCSSPFALNASLLSTTPTHLNASLLLLGTLTHGEHECHCPHVDVCSAAGMA